MLSTERFFFVLLQNNSDLKVKFTLLLPAHDLKCLKHLILSERQIKCMRRRKLSSGGNGTQYNSARGNLGNKCFHGNKKHLLILIIGGFDKIWTGPQAGSRTGPRTGSPIELRKKFQNSKFKTENSKPILPSK